MSIGYSFTYTDTALMFSARFLLFNITPFAFDVVPDVKNSILNSSSLVINSFDINNKFKLNYNYCYRDDKCINSYEYLSASATGSYFKTLMKISGEINIEKGINNSSIYDLRTFLNSFGVIHYKINNEWKKSYFNSSLVKPRVASTNDYYIEVPYDVKDSSELYFTFKIRNKSYKYVLK